LKDGVVNYSECAKIGKLFSVIEMALNNFLSSYEEPMEKRAYFLCIYRWYQFYLISFVTEVKFLLRSVKNEITDPPVLKISDDEEALKSISNFKHWIFTELIGKEFVSHQHIFLLANYLGFLKDKTFEDIVSEKDCTQILGEQKESILQISNLLDGASDSFLGDEEVEQSIALKAEIYSTLSSEFGRSEAHELIHNVVVKLPEFLDKFGHPINFDIQGIDLSNLDWEEIKNSYIEHVKSGKNDVCISLQPNGDVNISRHELAVLMSGNFDPDDSFLFWDQKHGHGMIRSISWSSVDDGSFFEELISIED
jgi:hypothetical protein